MSNDYIPLGWTESEYKTAKGYNPHGLNDDKADHMLKAIQNGVRYVSGDPLDFGEATIHDYRLQNNEVIYGD